MAYKEPGWAWLSSELAGHVESVGIRIDCCSAVVNRTVLFHRGRCLESVRPSVRGFFFGFFAGLLMGKLRLLLAVLAYFEEISFGMRQVV